MPPLSPATSDDDDCGGSSAVSVEGGVCHVINLSHTTVSGVLKVFSALKQPEFTTLELSHGELDQFALEKLTQTFLPMHTYGITTLKLSQCPLPEGVVTVLVRCFKETGSLRRLVLDTCRDVSMTALMTLTSLLQPIEHLELPSCKLPRQAGLILGQALQSCARLRTLILRHNHLGDGGARAIADVFHPKKKSTAYGRHVATTMDYSTNTPSIILDTLDLSDNGISNVGFCCILTISVRHLHVGRNNITSVRDVATTAHPHLTSLDMSYNPISTDGFDSFGGLITLAHANLTSLNIENCGITVAGLGSLKQAIRRHPTTKLREIRLGEDNSIDDAATRVGLADLLACISRVTPQVECIISPTIVPKTSPTTSTRVPHPPSNVQQLPPLLTTGSTNVQTKLAPETAQKHDTSMDESPQHQQEGENEDTFALNSPQSSTGTHSVHDDDVPDSPHDDMVRRDDTIASMAVAFDAHMAHQQRRLQHDAVVHQVRVKVETLATDVVPRLEARLDGVSDRLSTLQADMASQMNLMESNMATPEGRHTRGALSLLGPDVKYVDSCMTWKAEMEARAQDQLDQFQRWQVYMETDRMHLTNRVQELEVKVAGLENVVKAEQQASLLALEAISSAFASKY
ncbi:hypothetical protein, variant 4 [Aphanomyces astaci]|uniref:RNI-like protein n=1 Tax=Aphanomyces astaci TaxID=112090 RepID=W4FSY8_APHAT|nr:hypothetical protein, variant 4 [Aphanomyces astaci]ETV69768.1 hypothetical protein, variant 4 [Aphanomyces astaci]|eukprot:XP_009840789.1 hypothetical protein, variant 4 [Aphanomyces astaci]